MAIRSAVHSSLLAGACALLLAFAAPVSAQDRMDKPVRILVGFAPGGTADLIARVVADKLKDTIGQPVVVENRPGAAGRIAADAVKAAAPDGSTIMVMPIGPMAVVPHTLKAIPFDPVKDFTAIGLGATFQFALAAGPGSGAKTWAEFAAWAKANPAKASYATSAAGSLPHFVGVLLSRDIGVDMVHVAYKGSGAYMNDLIGGQVPSAIDTVADLSEQHRAGKHSHSRDDGRDARAGDARRADVQRARAQERRRVRLVRLLRAGQHAEGGDRHAEPRNQQGADVTRRRRAADEARHGSRDEHARGVRADRRFRLREMGPDREGVGLHRRLELRHRSRAPSVASQHGATPRAAGLHTQAPGNPSE